MKHLVQWRILSQWALETKTNQAYTSITSSTTTV